jgi:hypothetical protein
MKKLIAMLTFGFLVASSAFAAEAGKADSAWMEKAKAEYPTKTCVVSGQDLGEMGEPIDFVYKQEGKPDRLIRFCCKACLKTFRNNPSKYLKLLDEQVAAKK